MALTTITYMRQTYTLDVRTHIGRGVRHQTKQKRTQNKRIHSNIKMHPLTVPSWAQLGQTAPLNIHKHIAIGSTGPAREYGAWLPGANI